MLLVMIALILTKVEKKRTICQTFCRCGHCTVHTVSICVSEKLKWASLLAENMNNAESSAAVGLVLMWDVCPFYCFCFTKFLRYKHQQLTGRHANLPTFGRILLLSRCIPAILHEIHEIPLWQSYKSSTFLVTIWTLSCWKCVKMWSASAPPRTLPRKLAMLIQTP